jgi:peptide/nickel transport system ATP-binding protein
MFGHATPTLTPIPPFHPHFRKDIPIGGADIPGAKKLLAEAGIPEGFTLEMYVPGSNPPLRIGRQIAEPMVQHLGLPLPEALARAEIALREMGIDRAAQVACALPHQLSGGMKQRALIAAALACGPSLLVLGEPTTALDVTVEAQILRLLSRLKREQGVGLLFISHNLGVVRRLCDDVAVMYASQLVELGEVDCVLERPGHPYSKGLLASRLPLASVSRDSRLAAISGQMPTSPAPEADCVFAPRCPFHEPHCSEAPQPLTIGPDGHQVRCWRAAGLGPWPRQATAAAVTPVFCRGGALVNVTGLKKTFDPHTGLAGWRLSFADGKPILHRPTRVPAVNDVSFSISAGEVLGLVGESGCGKSTLGCLLLQLLRQSDGCVEFDGADLANLPTKALRPFRRQAQIVFQNVGSSLNPRLSVGEAIERPLTLFSLAQPRERTRRVEALLVMVRLPGTYRKRFPHQLSGGERQRVAIARALATEPLSSSATNRSPRSTFLCRQRSSICWPISATRSAYPTCSSRTIWRSWPSSPIASR